MEILRGQAACGERDAAELLVQRRTFAWVHPYGNLNGFASVSDRDAVGFAQGESVGYVSIRLLVNMGRGSDESQYTQGTGQLRRLLLQHGVESAELQRDEETPPGSKAGDGIVLGALLVTLAPHVFSSVVAAVQAWSTRASGRSVEIVEDGRSLTASGLSEAEQRELIADFRRRLHPTTDGETPDGRA